MAIQIKLKKWLQFFLNPHLLICVGIAWMITNGWCYVFTAIGSFFHIPWMFIVGTTYLGLLWLPFTPEKIITLFIAVFLLRWLFPHDQKTLEVLRRKQAKLKQILHRKHEARKQKKQHKKEAKRAGKPEE